MRAYSVATVAVALNVPGKWVDNILSHHYVPGVSASRQGIARRLTQEAVTVLAITLTLSRALAIAAPRALDIARALLEKGGPGARYAFSDRGTLLFDIAAIQADVSLQLDQAVEIAPTPRRGRPARRA